jgi:hypothetical protein
MAYFFIILTPIITFFLNEAFLFKVNLFYLSLGLTVLSYLVATGVITGKKPSSLDFWNFSIFPVLFSCSLSVYSLLIVNHAIIHFLFFLNLFISYFYFKNIYRGEKNDFLENISAYGNLLTIFFSFSVIYGLEFFLSWSIWILILCSSIIVIAIAYQIFWANRIVIKTSAAYIFLCGLLLAQLAWAVYFLPFNFNALGLIITICYYVLIGFIKLSLANKLTMRSVKMYLISSSVFIILLLLTIRWA